MSTLFAIIMLIFGSKMMIIMVMMIMNFNAIKKALN